MEHIDMKNSYESQLHFEYICSVRIRTVTQDKKPFPDTYPIPPKVWIDWWAHHVAASDAANFAIAACFVYG